MNILLRLKNIFRRTEVSPATKYTDLRIKLTAQQVIEIRGQKGKYTQAALAKMYGVSQSCIHQIHKGKSRGEVK